MTDNQNPARQTKMTGQSARLWPGQTVETVLQEMIAVAAGEYEGHEETLDPWTADNRADIDRWQCIISDALTPSPQTKMTGTEDQRGVGIGMAIAAGIIMRCWGQEVYAREILGAAGLDTLDKLKASGVDQYDIDALMPVVATTEGQP